MKKCGVPYGDGLEGLAQKKAPSPREVAGDNRKKVPVVSVSADRREAANRTYHGCKVCLKTEAEGALFSATNYCGGQRV